MTLSNEQIIELGKLENSSYFENRDFELGYHSALEEVFKILKLEEFLK